MNGDTIDHIVRFLEQEEDSLPSRVSNGMLLIAIREERQARKREIGEVLSSLKPVLRALNGQKPDGSDGLIQQVKALRHFKAALLWAVSAVVLAFLGGLGVYIFEWVFR
jgi:hypothetical protein